MASARRFVIALLLCADAPCFTRLAPPLIGDGEKVRPFLLSLLARPVPFLPTTYRAAKCFFPAGHQSRWDVLVGGSEVTTTIPTPPHVDPPSRYLHSAVPPWNVIMDQSVTPGWGSRVAVSPKNIVFTNTTINAEPPDETDAALFIIVVIGFLAFVMISLMVVNQLYAEPQEEDNYVDFLIHLTSKKNPVKLVQRNPPACVNQDIRTAAAGPASASDQFSEATSNLTVV